MQGWHLLRIRLRLAFLLVGFGVDRPTRHLPGQGMGLERGLPAPTSALFDRWGLPMLAHDLGHWAGAPRPPSG